MNTISKGNRAELERIKYLESIGYKVLPRPPRIKYKKSTDYFGFWDIVAYYPNGMWLVEQVKCNNGSFKEYKSYACDLPPETMARLVIRIDNKRGDDRWIVKNLKN